MKDNHGFYHIYAIKEDRRYDRDSYAIFNFCYLHGKLEKKNGFFDLFVMDKDDIAEIKANGKAIHNVVVHFDNEDYEYAKFYFWIALEGKMNCGLVVLLNSETDNKDAFKKYLDETYMI